MKISADRDYAVITGDIVGSSQLSRVEREKLVAEFRRASAALQKAFPQEVPLPAELFRGDGWQFLALTPGRALRLALFFRCWLVSRAPERRRVDTRMAIAVGRVSFVPGRSVSAGDGEAYRTSGKALDSLEEPFRLAYVLPATHPQAGAVGGLAPVVDALVQGWTARQARAVLGKLQDRTQEEIAAEWPGGISRQGIAGHLVKARWLALEKTLQWAESNL